MANTIKLKRGLSANIASAPLVEGEVALTTDTLELYTRKDNQNVKLTQKGESGVYIGTEAPTDSDINVWIDPSGDGENFIAQYTEMPTASGELVGKIVQYIGAYDGTYQDGSFYECITSPETSGEYAWVKITDNGCIYSAITSTKASLMVFTPGETDYQWSSHTAIGGAITYVNKAKEQGITQLDITFYKYGDASNTSCSFLVSRFRINPQTNAAISATCARAISIAYNAHGEFSTEYAVVTKCTSTLDLWYRDTTDKYFRMSLNFNGLKNATHAYLAKDNTVEFTPTEDYNPATKKYVDDAIAAGGGGGSATALSGTTAPTDDIGNVGDIYIMYD